MSPVPVIHRSTIVVVKDAEFLAWAIPFYLRREPQTILDATYGLGRFWTNSPLTPLVTGIDLIPRVPHVQKMDCTHTTFASGSFDVVTYDPPHLSDSVSPHSSKIYLHAYGDAGRAEHAGVTFPAAFKEISRLLVPGGICVTKIADMVNRARAQWHHFQCAEAAREADLTWCDLLVKVRKSALMSKWSHAYHARKYHCFWMVFRKGKC